MPFHHGDQPEADTRVRTKPEPNLVDYDYPLPPVARHPEQPGPRNKSDGRDRNQPANPLTVAVTGLVAAYEACKNTIANSRGLRGSLFGEDCNGIIDRRVDWVRKDAIDYRSRQFKAVTDAEKLDISVTHDTRALTQRLRVEEDRLRRMRADYLQYVADRPSSLSKRTRDGGPTYEEKIKSRLREAYERFREALAQYERPAQDAIEKEQARRRLEAQRRYRDRPSRDRPRAR